MAKDNIFNDDIIPFSGVMNGDSEFISIISDGEDASLEQLDIPDELSVLPLRGNVLFPNVIIPFTATREKSIKLIRDAKRKKQYIGVLAQINDTEDPRVEDLFTLGTVVRILRTFEMPDDNLMVVVQGVKRFSLEKIIKKEPFLKAKIKSFPDAEVTSGEINFDMLVDTMRDMYSQVIKAYPNLPPEAVLAVKNMTNKKMLVNFISSHLGISIQEKQQLLEASTLNHRAEDLLTHLTHQIQMLKVRDQIQQKVKFDLDKQQRDLLLNQQLKTIQEELGGSPSEQDINELKEKASTKKWPEETAKTFEKELQKLQRIHPASPDFSVQLNYLTTIVDLPWGEYTQDNFDLKHAEATLDADHFGLEKIKERILEYLAVLKLKGDMRSPILCLVGPPGVGKTSLGKSIASALDRKYIRIALGGLRDEAEIRGHRKTYIGAMPGRIIQSMLKAKSSNPVFVLDEIDKVSGMSVNGDPTAALLEVLDPEQNTAFHDNYLDIEYDLSKVLFIATANTISTIHPALLDRMEVLNISGYIIEEKIEIARRHLIPKQLEEHGIDQSKLHFSDEVLFRLINEYTRESGVRQLEKNIAKIIRSRTLKIAEKKKYSKNIEPSELKTILGLPIHSNNEFLKENIVGVVTGLAWTSVGGEILFIEASLSKGKGVLTMTGSLGDVMKESASLAFEYLKANAKLLNINPDIFETYNVHIHVPEGATPKDGPSAGIAMFVALSSVFMGRKVKANFAMTGEITLRGKVLPVGGIKEKILAAKRSKITDIVLSEENRRDIEDIKKDYLKGLKFHYIQTMSDIINLVLV